MIFWFLKRFFEINLINQIVLCFVLHFFSCSKRSISIFVFRIFWFFLERSIHSIAVKLILFVSIKIFRTKMILLLIMTSIELLFLSIHLISVISRRSYDWRKLITSIINRFFSIVFNFIKHWYKDLKSMQTINKMLNCNIFFIVAFRIVSKSNSWINSYNSKIKTLRITRLHLIKNQCKMLIRFDASIKQIT